MPEPVESIRLLREQALLVRAEALGFAASAALPHVWGVLLETGYPEGVVTLVALVDGTTSLYFSNGGGIIGAGEHASVRAANAAFLAAAEAQLGDFSPAAATPQPGLGRVCLHVRTFERTVGAEADEQELGEGGHALSRVFHAGHALISAIQEAAERPRS
jgi:hypothetical protein